jgi:thiamine-phosphate pyrophosphorylase
MLADQAMADAGKDRCRLCLVTPDGAAPVEFGPILEDALAGGDVASLIVTAGASDPGPLATALAPIAQAHGVAVLIHNDTQVAGRAKADGAHIDSGRADLAAAASSLRPAKIVGAGGLRSRHDAMLAADSDPDYLFFGRLDGDTDTTIFPKALALAEWWAEIFEIPAMVMGGSSLESVRHARDAGIEFVALRRAVWDHPNGPRAAVAEANRLLAASAETVL